MALIKCKECHKEVSSKAKHCPNCGAKVRKGPSSGIILLVAIIIGIAVSSNNTIPSTGHHTTSTQIDTVLLESESELRLISFRCTKEDGYFSIDGQVKNISSEKIDNVTAIGIFATRSGDVVKTDSTLIEYDTILPDQTSPFRVITKDNPLMEKCRVEFKRMFGDKIYTKYPEK